MAVMFTALILISASPCSMVSSWFYHLDILRNSHNANTYNPAIKWQQLI